MKRLARGLGLDDIPLRDFRKQTKMSVQISGGRSKSQGVEGYEMAVSRRNLCNLV